MTFKKSSEIQKIFGLSRDDINRLDKDGVLKPRRSGQGIASQYSNEDIYRLLDVKMYLLAGYRISDMKNILTSSYDSDSGISEQIHIYKKRIQMLEFIRVMRADFNELEQFSAKQVIEFNKKAAKNSNLPDYGTDEYFESAWEYLEMIFLVDFLSQRESLNSEKEEVLDKVLEAYKLVGKILELSGTEIDQNEVKDFILTIADYSDEDDMEVKDYIKEIIDEYLSNKEQIADELEKECIVPQTRGLKEEMAVIYKKILKHFFEFSLSYFVDEEELYCIYINLKRFAQNIDIKALEQGIVRLEGRKE